MRIREDIIHYAVRQFLKDAGWQLIAGQFPNGSDSELPTLNVVDPALARDNSPDHRRHSKNKYVPDLVATKGRLALVIEMKPEYSVHDETKLQILLAERREDLLTAMESLVSKRGISLPFAVRSLTVVPCLGFGIQSSYQRNSTFCYFKVADIGSVAFEGCSDLSSI